MHGKISVAQEKVRNLEHRASQVWHARSARPIGEVLRDTGIFSKREAKCRDDALLPHKAPDRYALLRCEVRVALFSIHSGDDRGSRLGVVDGCRDEVTVQELCREQRTGDGKALCVDVGTTESSRANANVKAKLGIAVRRAWVIRVRRTFGANHEFVRDNLPPRVIIQNANEIVAACREELLQRECGDLQQLTECLVCESEERALVVASFVRHGRRVYQVYRISVEEERVERTGVVRVARFVESTLQDTQRARFDGRVLFVQIAHEVSVAISAYYFHYFRWSV